MNIGFIVKSVLVVGIAAYALIAAGLYFNQRRMMYGADPTRTAPADAGLPDVEEKIIDTPDGQKIIAWYGRAKPGQPTIVYFHGNAGTLEGRRDRIRKYLNRGRGMFMMAYRGYSGSTGSPTEADNVADAKLAYDALLREGVRPDDIIIYGESLGTGVAVQVAIEKAVRGVVLDSPYTSLPDRAAELYPYFPVRFLMKDRYETSKHIGQMKVPLFILHGEADQIVPVEMGRKIFSLANEPKEIVTLPGAGHADHWQFGSFEVINAWIDRLWSGEIRAGHARA